jgi:hypothetical protein
MDRRIGWVIAAIAVLGGLIWFFTRSTDESVPVAERMDSVATTPETGVGADRVATSLENASAESRVATVSESVSRLSSPAPAVVEALPIDVSPGFEFLDTPASEMSDTNGMWPYWRRHQQLQSEARDEAWAPRMEAALRGGIQNALSARGLDAQRIELPVVECRSTGCEIQAVGYPEDNLQEGADLQLILPELLKGGLEHEIDMAGYGLMMSSREDQRLTYLAHLPRKMH